MLGVSDSHCVFFDGGRGQHCRVQHALGHAALPLACRQFPRVTVQTPLGPSVTLSHYCPTAADLLRAPGPARVVTHAPAFPEQGEYVGLDVRTALPPLLCPDVLMDWESWHALEDHAVHLLCQVAGTPEDGLSRLHGAVEHLRRWRPGSTSLGTAIDEAFTRATREAHTHQVDRQRRVAEVIAAIPTGDHDRVAPPSGGPRESADVKARFLAAHAFANWTGYAGCGVRAWFRSIEAAYALLEAYGVARADLFLRHLSDTSELTRTWNQAESRQ